MKWPAVGVAGMRGEWGRGGGCDFQARHRARCFMIAKDLVPLEVPDPSRSWKCRGKRGQPVPLRRERVIPGRRETSRRWLAERGWPAADQQVINRHVLAVYQKYRLSCSAVAWVRASFARGRPLRPLAAFTTVTAKARPGASGGWVRPPGEFTVRIGRSSADLRLSVRVRSG